MGRDPLFLATKAGTFSGVGISGVGRSICLPLRGLVNRSRDRGNFSKSFASWRLKISRRIPGQVEIVHSPIMIDDALSSGNNRFNLAVQSRTTAISFTPRAKFHRFRKTIIYSIQCAPSTGAEFCQITLKFISRTLFS